jgi:hypothetical protein
MLQRPFNGTGLESKPARLRRIGDGSGVGLTMPTTPRSAALDGLLDELLEEEEGTSSGGNGGRPKPQLHRQVGGQRQHYCNARFSKASVAIFLLMSCAITVVPSHCPLLAISLPSPRHLIASHCPLVAVSYTA